MLNTTTIEIDKDTHLLIRQYCIINDIKLKDFIRDLTTDKLKGFSRNIERIKKIDK